MASPVSCSPCCSTATTTQIVGPAGADASALAPIGGNTPEGVQVGNPGQTILCTGNNSFWVKATGSATNTGWVQLIGGAA